MATSALKNVTSQTSKRERAEQDWRDSICHAVAEGHSFRKVAEAAGISHTRVYQIVRGQ